MDGEYMKIKPKVTNMLGNGKMIERKVMGDRLH